RDIMTRLTLGLGYDQAPVWSPDGKHIVFTSVKQSPAASLNWMRADGAGATVLLTQSNNQIGASSFSPDGRRLAFQSWNSQTRWDLLTLPLEEVETDHPKTRAPEILLQTPFSETMPVISPDGRWVAYVSDESGSAEVYVRRFPDAGGKLRISTEGG